MAAKNALLEIAESIATPLLFAAIGVVISKYLAIRGFFFAQ